MEAAAVLTKPGEAARICAECSPSGPGRSREFPLPACRYDRVRQGWSRCWFRPRTSHSAPLTAGPLDGPEHDRVLRYCGTSSLVPCRGCLQRFHWLHKTADRITLSRSFAKWDRTSAVQSTEQIDESAHVDGILCRPKSLL